MPSIEPRHTIENGALRAARRAGHRRGAPTASDRPRTTPRTRPRRRPPTPRWRSRRRRRSRRVASTSAPRPGRRTPSASTRSDGDGIDHDRGPSVRLASPASVASFAAADRDARRPQSRNARGDRRPMPRLPPVTSDPRARRARGPSRQPRSSSRGSSRQASALPGQRDLGARAASVGPPDTSAFSGSSSPGDRDPVRVTRATEREIAHDPSQRVVARRRIARARPPDAGRAMPRRRPRPRRSPKRCVADRDVATVPSDASLDLHGDHVGIAHEPRDERRGRPPVDLVGLTDLLDAALR